MPIAKILIITDKNDRTAKFSSRPFNLPVDRFFATGLDSLKYIGLQIYSTILIDFDVSNLLRKVALGISDDELSESMWSLLAKDRKANVYFLTERITPPTRDMRSLGIEFVLPSGVLGLLDTNDNSAHSHNGNLSLSSLSTNKSNTASMLTADDIREMHRAGNKTFDAGLRLTPWAKEVADSLDMSEENREITLIINIQAQSRAELIKDRERIFSLSTAHTNLLFAMPSAIIPIFNDLFPSIGGRVICIGISWAEKGAFTGENSMDMLKSVGCYGSIVLDKDPYTKVENISKLLKLADKSSFKLFSFFPLAHETECGIIEQNKNTLFTPLMDAKDLSECPSGYIGALVVDDEYLEKNKERNL